MKKLFPALIAFVLLFTSCTVTPGDSGSSDVGPSSSTPGETIVEGPLSDWSELPSTATIAEQSLKFAPPADISGTVSQATTYFNEFTDGFSVSYKVTPGRIGGGIIAVTLFGSKTGAWTKGLIFRLYPNMLRITDTTGDATVDNIQNGDCKTDGNATINEGFNDVKVAVEGGKVSVELNGVLILKDYTPASIENGKMIIGVQFAGSATQSDVYKINRFTIEESGEGMKYFTENTQAGAVGGEDEVKDYKIADVDGFDESNVVLTFGALSDAHYANDSKNVKHKKAVELLEKFAANTASKRLDLIISTGDDLNSGFDSELKNFTDDVNDYILGAGYKYVFAHGGHEYISDTFTAKKFMDALDKSVYDCYLSAEDAKNGYRHAVVNGYHFIGFDVSDKVGGWVSQDDVIKKELLDKLRADLEDITSKEPDKYVFVMAHDPLYETTRKAPVNKKVKEVLDDFPQVIYLCGHSHALMTDERNLWQGDFTLINLASLSYYASYYFAEEAFPKQHITGSPYGVNLYDMAQCGLVQIDKNGAVKFTRIDIENEEVVATPWVFNPVDSENETHLEKYSLENRKNGKSAPSFPENGFSVKYSVLNSGSLKLTFEKAYDSEMVFGYSVSIFEKGVRAAKLNAFSLGGWYVRGDQSKIPAEHIVEISRVKLSRDKSYIIEITAEDCYGNQSATYSIEISGTPGSGRATAKKAGTGTALSSSWAISENSADYANKDYLMPNANYSEMKSTNGGLLLTNFKGYADFLNWGSIIANNSEKIAVDGAEIKLSVNYIGWQGSAGIALTKNGARLTDSGSVNVSAKDGIAISFKNVDPESFQEESTEIYPVITTATRSFNLKNIKLNKNEEITVKLEKSGSGYKLLINGADTGVDVSYLEGFFENKEATLSSFIIAGAFYHTEMTVTEINGTAAATYGN
ncbi:MAG: metallophosphoesterase [Clostridia bacterium]|nr:metallophosphoesterase [Clostridia bacterium]